MKIDYTKIENATNTSFDYAGKHWTLDTTKTKNTGFSANGVWNCYTNGVDHVTIYKADVLKVSHEIALKLFN